MALVRAGRAEEALAAHRASQLMWACAADEGAAAALRAAAAAVSAEHLAEARAAAFFALCLHTTQGIVSSCEALTSGKRLQCVCRCCQCIKVALALLPTSRREGLACCAACMQTVSLALSATARHYHNLVQAGCAQTPRRPCDDSRDGCMLHFMPADLLHIPIITNNAYAPLW